MLLTESWHSLFTKAVEALDPLGMVIIINCWNQRSLSQSAWHKKTSKVLHPTNKLFIRNIASRRWWLHDSVGKANAEVAAGKRRERSWQGGMKKGKFASVWKFFLLNVTKSGCSTATLSKVSKAKIVSKWRSARFHGLGLLRSLDEYIFWWVSGFPKTHQFSAKCFLVGIRVTKNPPVFEKPGNPPAFDQMWKKLTCFRSDLRHHNPYC